jgi:SAM-dependent methyltransferase
MTDAVAASASASASAFKAEESGAYDEAADRFAALSERYSGDLARRLVELAGLAPGERVLDVGTGAGLLAAAAAPRAGRVLGIDISAALLDRARGIADARGLGGHVEYRLMDAEALTLEDASFDAAVSLFALLHLPDPLRALQEMRRVLRPGGRLVVGVGSGAPVSLAGLAHRAGRLGALWQERRGRRLVAPGSLESLLTRRLGHDEGASAHWQEHAREHGAAGLARLVGDAGFADVQSSWQGRDLEVATASEFWDLQRTFSSRARRRLADVPPALLEELRREMEAESAAVLARGGRLVYPQGVLFVRARRPER